MVQNNDDSKIYVKLIPREEFNPSRGFKRAFYERSEQKSFSIDFFKDNGVIGKDTPNKQTIDALPHTFYVYKNNYYRKGFIYKHFSLKQIDS